MILYEKMKPEKQWIGCSSYFLIEARFCERFDFLRKHMEERDAELATFYGSLFESEARHHTTYVRLANIFATEDVVKQRLQELSAWEAEIIAEGDDMPRMHSWS